MLQTQQNYDDICWLCLVCILWLFIYLTFYYFIWSSYENLGHILKINKTNRITVNLQNIPFNMKSYLVIVITVLQNSEIV